MVDHCPAWQDRGHIVDEAIAAVLSSVDLEVVLDRTARLLRRFFGATRVSINRCAASDPGYAEVLLVDDPKGTAPARGARFPLEGSACGMAVAKREPWVLERIDAAHPRYREEGPLGALGYGSLVSFPLIVEDEVLGTLGIAHVPREGPLECCMQTAGQIARLLAIALHTSLMVEEVKRLNRLLDHENSLLKEEIGRARKGVRYVAESPLMREVLDKVRLVASSDTTVVIRGETGTGKEGLARLVHEFSPRFGGPFVVVNLGAIPETLIESELFGHEKGAFTGASRAKPGRFEQAEGGTIFLDEIGDAPPPVQVRLLRVLQEREVQRIGGTASIAVNVRVVAATNRPLEKMVEEGTFRSDLYYRLNIFPIHLPPLRERKADIRPLGTYFVSRHAALMNRKAPRVPEAVWRALEAYDWPGNIREMENVLERALILSRGADLLLPDLPRPQPDGRAAAAPRADAAVGRFDDHVRDLLRRALAATGNRVYGPRGAAILLGLKPTTLQGKLRKYGLAAAPAARPRGSAPPPRAR